jgi:hypothetical protein
VNRGTRYIMSNNMNLVPLRIAFTLIVAAMTTGCSLSFPHDEFRKTCKKYVSIEVYDPQRWQLFVEEMKRNKETTRINDGPLNLRENYRMRSSLGAKNNSHSIPFEDKVIYPMTLMIFDKHERYIGLINDLMLSWPSFGYTPVNNCSEYHEIRNQMLNQIASAKSE